MYCLEHFVSQENMLKNYQNEICDNIKHYLERTIWQYEALFGMKCITDSSKHFVWNELSSYIIDSIKHFVWNEI